MSNNLKIDEIIKNFGVNSSFTSKDLFEFYKTYESNLKEGTFRWRVYELKKAGLLSNVKRGVYIIDNKKKFNPQITRSMKSIYNMIIKNYPYSEVCIWSTSWFNDFMNHQLYNSYIIVEVDRDIMNSVFNFLKDKKNNVYLNPNEREIENYLLSENAIVLKHKIKEAPTLRIENVIASKLEKMLVDLYFEKDLLVSYQGYEMKNIFERAFSEYEINITTLYRYARNRGVRDQIKLYIQDETDIAIKDNKESL